MATPTSTHSPALFHLGFRLPSDLPHLRARFADVKYVLLAGSNSRAELLATRLREASPEVSAEESGNNSSGLSSSSLCDELPAEANICTTGRYALFQPLRAVLTASHGIGKGSADILFHEITSMLRLAGATQFCYIRLGSCGGVGVDAGSLIVTDKVVNGEGKSLMTSIVLGKRQEYPAAVCPALSARLQRVAEAMYGPAAVHKGTTMTCDSFYTEQGRMDGAFCGYTQDEQWRFLARCRDELMVRNFEMEALCLASFCTRAQIPCAVVCAALVNRMAEKGVDSPTAADVVLKEWEERPVMVAVRFVIDALKGAAGQG